jgi:tripartite-type tricarboxylate transporter receptor subunit TctC
MKLPRRQFLHLAAGAAALPAASRIAAAQSYPSRPITMVVPFAAGGPLDAVGRVLTPRLSDVLGQQVIIENVVGAGGMTGASRVAKAASDGYQIFLGNIGTHAYNQTLYKKPLYSAATDFSPVTLIGFGYYLLVVRNNLPVNSLPEFIAYATANQSKIQYGSGGAGSASHISCMLLNQKMATNIAHVPYRGAAPALQDLIGGRLDFMCDSILTSLSQIQGGMVKAIANLSSQRTGLLPNLATAQEQGITEFAVYGWSAIFCPKGTDQAVIHRLNTAISEVLDTPSVRERLESLGYSLSTPEQRGPAYLAKFVVAEIEKWADPIKASGVSMD